MWIFWPYCLHDNHLPVSTCPYYLHYNHLPVSASATTINLIPISLAVQTLDLRILVQNLLVLSLDLAKITFTYHLSVFISNHVAFLLDLQLAMISQQSHSWPSPKPRHKKTHESPSLELWCRQVVNNIHIQPYLNCIIAAAPMSRDINATLDIDLTTETSGSQWQWQRRNFMLQIRNGSFRRLSIVLRP